MQNSGDTLPNNYDLTRLFEYVGTDPQVVRDMVSVFIDAVVESLGKMEESLHTPDCKNLARESHKIKTSLQIFGFDDQLETVRLFELSTECLPDDAIKRFYQLKQRLFNGIEALKEDFNLI